jgi:hypothetical protein
MITQHDDQLVVEDVTLQKFQSTIPAAQNYVWIIYTTN